MSPPADRNLLFGVLAHLNGFLTRDQLRDVLRDWATDKATPLAALAVARGLISPDDRALVEALDERHLARHGGDARAGLAALPGAATLHADLEPFADTDPRDAPPGPPPGDAPTVTHAAPTVTHGVGSDGASETASWEGDRFTLTSRFRVVRSHARGGLGEIFLAQDEALGRRVALKHIQDRWVDDPQSRARFLVEAEITGGLDHPFIVPIHGLGFDREGRPFYAMRFIEGQTLRDAAKQFHGALTHPRPIGPELVAFRDLLGRFVQVCQAVHYAHERGVIHRDIKPGNIMLGKHGETLVVDWGLAKVVGRDEATPPDAEPSLHPSSGSDVQTTATGALVGTPEYMAPEQAAGRVHDLDRRSDVYALGATLYHLLTARASVDPGDMAAKVRQITTGAIPPPRQAARPEGVAVKLDLPRPLEAICRRAMALKPEDRYATTATLAVEIQQFLAGEPVAAYRENVRERSRRWVRRHRTLATTAAALLVAGLIGATAFAAVVGGKNRELASLYTVSETRLDRAMAAIKDYYSGFSEEALLGEQVPQALRERLLAKPVQYYEDLTRELSAKRNPSPRERALLAEGRYSLARILAILGRHAEARHQGEVAIALYEALVAAQPGVPEYRHRLANAYTNLGLVLRDAGEADAARQAYEKAVALREALGATQPDVPEYQEGLAITYTNLGLFLRDVGEPAAARQAFEQAMARYEALAAAQPDASKSQAGLAMAYGNLGLFLRDVGEAAASRQSLEKSVARYEALAAAQPDVPEYQRGLAGSYSSLAGVLYAAGGLAAARQAYEKAIARCEALVAAQPGVPDYQHRLAIAYGNLGLVLNTAGEPAAARQAFEKAMARYEALVAAQPGVPKYQDGLAGNYTSLGDVLRDAGELAAARKAFEKAVALYEALVAAQPGVPDYQAGLANSYLNLGNILSDLGEPAAARQAYEQAITHFEALVAAQPGMPEYQHLLARSYNNLGDALRDAGEAAAARRALEKAVALYEVLVAAQPDVPEYQAGLARNYGNLGRILREVGEPVATRQAYEKAIARFEVLVAAQPGAPTYQENLASGYNELGLVLREAGEPAAARRAFEKAIARFEELVAAQPGVPKYQHGLAGSYGNLGTLLNEAGEPAAARQAHEKAIARSEALVAAQPGVPDYQFGLATSYNNLGLTLLAAREPAAARQAFEQAVARYEALLAAQPGVPKYQAGLAMSYNNLGLVLSELGEPAAARQVYRKALPLWEALAREHPEAPDYASALGGLLNNLALFDLGAKRFEEARDNLRQAIAWQRKALAANPNHPQYRQFLANHLTNLIRAAHGLGDADEAAEARRELVALRQANPAIKQLDARLAAVMNGESPKDNTERLRLAYRAYETGRHAASARLFAEALASDPALGADRRAQHRYNAACAAALAAAERTPTQPSPIQGEGKIMDDTARVKLRTQALGWLEAELAAWARLLDAGTPEVRAVIAQTLQHWKADADLVSVRDADALAALPEPERAAWRALWARVEELLAKARARAPGAADGRDPTLPADAFAR